MRFHLHSEQKEPCPHMVGLLNKAADGSSKGFARWYALAHAARCEPCRRFLMGLEALVAQLRNAKAKEPSEEALARLQNGDWRRKTD